MRKTLLTDPKKHQRRENPKKRRKNLKEKNLCKKKYSKMYTHLYTLSTSRVQQITIKIQVRENHYKMNLTKKKRENPKKEKEKNE